MSTYSQIPIRLRLSLISAPPVAPVDDNTGLAPKFFRAADIALAIGIFDSSGDAVDLSNLTELQVILQPAVDSLTPSAIVVIPASVITASIELAGWQDGSQAQAVAVFTAAQTDVGLNAQPSQDYWLIVQGVTAGGQTLPYGAGIVTVYDSGSQTPPAVNYVDGNLQTNSGAVSTITPKSQLHTEILTVAGASSRTTDVILVQDGMQLGSRMWIELPIPQSGVTLRLRSGTIGGPIVQTYVTTGASAQLEFYFDGTQWQEAS